MQSTEDNMKSKSTAIVFCRINKNYWSQIVDRSCDSKAIKLHNLRDKHRAGLSTIGGLTLAPFFPNHRFENAEYMLFISDECVAYKMYQSTGWLSRPEMQLKGFASDTELCVQTFFRQHLQKVRSILNDPNSEIPEIAKAMQHYLFCEHYSIWYYSKSTRFFTLFDSSFAPECDYFHLDGPDNTLKGSLLADKSYTEKTIAQGLLKSKPLEYMRTAIRFRANVLRQNPATALSSNHVDQSQAIFSFFSPLEDFFLLPDQISDLQLCADSVVSRETAIFTVRSTHLLESGLASYKPSQLDEFLRGICQSVTSKCGWEAASILLVDNLDRPTRLILSAASVPSSGPPPAFGSTYDLNKQGKTVSVFKDRCLRFSYDLENDPLNSHIIDDFTIHPPTNWVGVPILNGEKPVGVLRAKNMCYNSKIIPFNDLDISLLRHCSELIAQIYNIESNAKSERDRQNKALEKEREQLERETKMRIQLEKANEQLTEYVQTFQHELKSPLSIFNEIRERLGRALLAEGLIKYGDSLPKQLRELCEDTESLTNRLTFITSLMELHPSDIVQELRRCDCFRAIVAPILKFAELYARRRSLELRCKKQSLFLPVFCDPRAASLALHTLIDNAIKYADPGSVILIEGIPRADACTIRVTNFGLPILVDEKSDIFLKNFRGKEAKRQKIGGAGIGLYLAREVMNHNNGNVDVISLSNPVIFDLVILSTPNH
jgi:signal transduction histidine kinase